MLLPGYDLDKAAQVVAFFALKEGGEINVLKLAKLVYLAERESMRLYDEPMFYDRLVSMPDGPVTSVTLNFMNGSNTDDRWSRFVAPRSGYNIPLSRRDIQVLDLDHLSTADLEILESLWRKFGGYDQYRIRDWTHVPQNVPEWSDPQGSSEPIPHERVFRGLNKSHSAELDLAVTEFRSLSKALNSAS